MAVPEVLVSPLNSRESAGLKETVSKVEDVLLQSGEVEQVQLFICCCPDVFFKMAELV